jgi:hypothetical protein
MVRRVSRAWTSFLGSPRTGMGYGSKLVPGALTGFELAIEDEGGIACWR